VGDFVFSCRNTAEAFVQSPALNHATWSGGGLFGAGKAARRPARLDQPVLNGPIVDCRSLLSRAWSDNHQDHLAAGFRFCGFLGARLPRQEVLVSCQPLKSLDSCWVIANIAITIRIRFMTPPRFREAATLL
jgi:hypothetical protein